MMKMTSDQVMQANAYRSKIRHILHIIRNPYGWSNDDVHNARHMAADEIERLISEVETLKHPLYIVSVGFDASTDPQCAKDYIECKWRWTGKAPEALVKEIFEVAWLAGRGPEIKRFEG